MDSEGKCLPMRFIGKKFNWFSGRIKFFCQICKRSKMLLARLHSWLSDASARVFKNPGLAGKA